LKKKVFNLSKEKKKKKQLTETGPKAIH